MDIKEMDMLSYFNHVLGCLREHFKSEPVIFRLHLRSDKFTVRMEHHGDLSNRWATERPFEYVNNRFVFDYEKHRESFRDYIDIYKQKNILGS